MKRRLASFPLILSLALIPVLTPGARGQDQGDQRDGGESGAARNEDADAPDESKPAAVPEAKSDIAVIKVDEDKGADESKQADDAKDAGEKPLVSVKVVSPDGEKPAQADVSVEDAPHPKPRKKTAKAKSVRAGKKKLAPVKTPDAVKKTVAAPPAPPPPPAVPSTPVQPWNP